MNPPRKRFREIGTSTSSRTRREGASAVSYVDDPLSLNYKYDRDRPREVDERGWQVATIPAGTVFYSGDPTNFHRDGIPTHGIYGEPGVFMSPFRGYAQAYAEDFLPEEAEDGEDRPVSYLNVIRTLRPLRIVAMDDPHTASEVYRLAASLIPFSRHRMNSLLLGPRICRVDVPLAKYKYEPHDDVVLAEIACSQGYDGYGSVWIPDTTGNAHGPEVFVCSPTDERLIVVRSIPWHDDQDDPEWEAASRYYNHIERKALALHYGLSSSCDDDAYEPTNDVWRS